MKDEEYEDLLLYHIGRAHEKEYDALTVETKLLEEAYVRHISGHASNGYRANKES